MKNFRLTLRLEEDAVFSERAATVGGHRGLDYIPGGSILGAVAAALYHRHPKSAFQLFHSGQVRFGNGRPVTKEGQPTYPMPLCWHYAKGQTVAKEGRLCAEKIFHLGHCPDLPENRQPKQLREGYLSCLGDQVKPSKALRLKTAIDPSTGVAREAALFGYDAIAAGQCFSATLAIDNTIDDALVTQICEVLQGTLRLGRSRSAEYGRVQVDITTESTLPTDNSTEKEISLWLLSDLAAVDCWYQPSLHPQPEWLGLPPGEFVLERSFVRSRRYSPWNAYRGRPMLERQVLCQGSVLCFSLQDQLHDQEKSKIALGLGFHCEAGLGQVWLNAPLLATKNPQFCDQELATDSTKNQASNSESVTIARPQSDLISWLEQQQKQTITQDDLTKQARKIAQEYSEMLRSARRLQGIEKTIPIGPSRSQWGNVQAKMKEAETSQVPHEACNGKQPGWKEEYWDKSQKRPISFAAWLQKTTERQSPRFVQLLAREIMAIL